MLPHFICQRFGEVLADLKRAGYAFDADGSRRISSSAIPCSGGCTHAGIDLELRQATEPWYVLGEEPAGGRRRAMWIPRWSACR